MKERPILFSGAMVRALLAGTKTQTRRMVKPQPQMVTNRTIVIWDGPASALKYKLERIGRGCPCGQPGDRLWVRETWARTNVFPGTELVVYREGDNRTDYGGTWKPGIHMCRRDSRITLEVTGVRVERLQDISEEDAQAEGADSCVWDGIEDDIGALIDWPLKETANPYRNGYALLWEQINGPASWASNPWVWVVEFRRLP